MGPSFQTIPSTFLKNDVEFVVVGGVAAVLHGAPVTTFDLDALIKVSDANADRLFNALTTLQARYRLHSPPLKPSKSDILAGGHLLLATVAGPLDLLGFIGDQQRFDDLQAEFEAIRFEGLSFQVLSLDELIRQKRWLGREKDMAALRMLELLQRELRTKKSL
jgi:hypothetical protein